MHTHLVVDAGEKVVAVLEKKYRLSKRKHPELEKGAQANEAEARHDGIRWR